MSISVLAKRRARFQVAWRQHLPADHYCPFHGHPDFELVYHLGNAGETRVRHGPTIAFAAGCVVLYPPRAMHDQKSAAEGDDLVDMVRRAIQRATALTANDLKKGIPALATIGATAPFVGLLGTVVGVINAFAGIGSTGSAGLGAVSAGISEALIETALGLVVAIPAVWMYNYFTGHLEYFNVEMDNSSSELVDYFIKKTA